MLTNKNRLSAEFNARFGREPEFFVRAPGRVNLIGEHTDYNGFPVLPIAIPFSIHAAAASRPDSIVCIDNISSEFPRRSFHIEREIPPSPPGDWSNYVKAAVVRIIQSSGCMLRGMNVLFSGDIPSSAGLSSSSALVISAALAYSAVNGLQYDPSELAELMAEGERYVGTQGGGMDQAICLLAAGNAALRIDFFPLRHRTVPFPSGCSIMAAHSLIRAAKTENALVHYNRRPAECRLATLLINRLYRPDPPIRRLGDLPPTGILDRFTDSTEFVNSTFREESYTLSGIAGIAGLTEHKIVEQCLLTRSGVPMPEPDDGFLLKGRVRHILTEAARVEKSCEALAGGDAEAFGHLMNQSHESCRSDYGISTIELDTLTSIMRDAGALGSRLTGAGFGGCAIALVHDSDIDKVAAAVQTRYYETYIPASHPELEKQGLIFTVKPSDGAHVEPISLS